MSRANVSHDRGGRKAPLRQRSSIRNALARYEQLKAAWTAANPASTPEQYDAAMARFAKLTGA